jgi:hexosaminidase
MERLEGIFRINPETRIFYDAHTRETAFSLSSLLKGSAGLDIVPEKTSSAKGVKNSISFYVNKTVPKDGYNLQVLSDKVLVKAGSAQSAFYAFQTLRQLLPNEIEKRGYKRALPCIPAVNIVDYPGFQYRGGHLDVGRHYFSVDYIKKYIDFLAFYKFNYFHWHLTDDQGWRIEIKKYPQLSEISAWRNENNRKYGKIYTQDEIKEIVKYASDKKITVVPEIEMPGHSSAVIAAFPEFSCTGEKISVPTRRGTFKDVYCAGNDKVFDFLYDVLEEVVPLFPGKYFHIGGDECEKTRWKKCAKCQKRIKQENLENEDELQAWFLKKIVDFLISRNKNPVGWEEINEYYPIEGVTIMSWTSMAAGIKAAKMGYPAIMCPQESCYFNFKYPDMTGEPGVKFDGEQKKTYLFDPLAGDMLSIEESQYILGGQFCVWTENIDRECDLELLTFPRICEMAEVLWTPLEKRGLESFKRRLKLHLERLKIMGINYYKKSYLQ